MSTPFSDIYSLNNVVRLDNRIINKPDNLIYELYYRYLTFAISYFVVECFKTSNKDLDNHIPFSQTEYEFIGDGTNSVFTLDTLPVSNENFYVSVNGVSKNHSFSYDEINNQMTITPSPPIDSEVYIASYIIGEFNIDLNTTEKVILAEGMNVPWLEEKRNHDTLLNQMVYGGDYDIHSQANHINSLNASIDNQYYKMVQGLIKKYTYQQSLNKLKGLGGGLV